MDQLRFEQPIICSSSEYTVLGIDFYTIAPPRFAIKCLLAFVMHPYNPVLILRFILSCTCPIVEEQDLELRYSLMWNLTWSLNPTSSMYAPLRPHLPETKSYYLSNVPKENTPYFKVYMYLRGAERVCTSSRFEIGYSFDVWLFGLKQRIFFVYWRDLRLWIKLFFEPLWNGRQYYQGL